MTTLPGPLVDGGWLQAQLGASDLRIIETTCHLDPPTAPGRPYDVRSGRADWEAGHIPGSAFADVDGELAEPHPTLHFSYPSPARFAAAMSALGVQDETVVVIYDRGGPQWATRLWWLLRSYGFDDAAVLDGGWDAWLQDERPVSDEPAPPREDARFRVRTRPELIADKAEVAAAIDRDVLLLNALAPEVFAGTQLRYGDRPGRIPGSVNVYAQQLVHPQTRRFLPREQLEAKLDGVGALRDDRVIAYCGGGISATVDAFALALLGAPDVALYDGSMSEWVADAAAPLERD